MLRSLRFIKSCSHSDNELVANLVCMMNNVNVSPILECFNNFAYLNNVSNNYDDLINAIHVPLNPDTTDYVICEGIKELCEMKFNYELVDQIFDIEDIDLLIEMLCCQ